MFAKGKKITVKEGRSDEGSLKNQERMPISRKVPWEITLAQIPK